MVILKTNYEASFIDNDNRKVVFFQQCKRKQNIIFHHFLWYVWCGIKEHVIQLGISLIKPDYNMLHKKTNRLWKGGVKINHCKKCIIFPWKTFLHMFAEIVFEPHKKKWLLWKYNLSWQKSILFWYTATRFGMHEKTIWKRICVCASLLTILRYKHLVTSYHECVWKDIYVCVCICAYVCMIRYLRKYMSLVAFFGI